jgi:Mrp family chromosome partitioning ATPase
MLADKTLFVVRWAKTRRETASLAVTRLQEAGADIAGLVLSRVDVRRHSKYSYSDPAYQRAGVAKYYVG